MPPTASEFRVELREQIARAQRQGRPHIEINAGELHRVLGGYPPKAGDPAAAMPTCCEVMWQEYVRGNDDVIHRTDSGHSASLTIRYQFPRD